MHITVDSSMFIDAFRRMGRENQFSREALGALFNYLEEYEQDTGEDLELDVVALCCDFTEYETAVKAVADYYGFTSELEAEEYNSPEDFEEAREDEAREWLEDRTTVIDFDGGLIVKNF